MKKILINTIALALILALFASCSKYEDGPWISFRSPEKRIEGTWQVEYFCRNNEDLTDFYIQNYNWRFGFGSSNPEDPTQPAYMCRQLRSNCEYDSLDTISITNVFSYWRFFANDSLQMPILTLPGEYPPYCGFYPLFPGVSEFKILKLTYSKLWLEHTKNDTTYLIKMKK